MYSDQLELIREMLMYWLESAVDSHPPHWKTIVTALRSPLVNEIHLADQLESKYCAAEQRMKEEPSSSLITEGITVVSRKHAPPPPFATLASVQNAERGGLYARCDNFSRDYALPSRHEVIAHDASGRLMSFSVEERGSRTLPQSSWRAIVDAGGPCSL